MTDCSCAGAFGARTGTKCSCGDDAPAVNPFHAMRVGYGMLLGEDDFGVLMGNPRGKQMLHTSWLHGSGVVWGFPVTYDSADDELAVGPGLATDRRGRDLRAEVRDCLTVSDWAAAWLRTHDLPEPDAHGKRVLTAWVVARYRACPEAPVPAVADPCDVTRRHEEFSRWFETTCLDIVEEPSPRPHRFPRVRALLGLVCPGHGAPAACPEPECVDTPAGERCAHVTAEVEEALAAVAGTGADERACVLLQWFRTLAARDVTDWPHGTDEDPPLFPIGSEQSGEADCDEGADADVVLARIEVPVTDDAGCVRTGAVIVDPWVRSALFPTATIQELVCGLAPGVLGETTTEPDAGGPRLVSDSVRWERSNTRLRFRLTRHALPGSQERAVEVSSLSDQGAGWAVSTIDDIKIVEDGYEIVVDLDTAPAYRTVRVIVRGTGPEPLYGRAPVVPFAGLDGGPPGRLENGHDAVITSRLSASGRAES